MKKTKETDFLITNTLASSLQIIAAEELGLGAEFYDEAQRYIETGVMPSETWIKFSLAANAAQEKVMQSGRIDEAMVITDKYLAKHQTAFPHSVKEVAS